jgi:hypothetical protein
MTSPPAVVPDGLLACAEPGLYSQVQARLVDGLTDHPSTAVVVPYRETPDRAPLLRWVHRQWSRHADANPDVQFVQFVVATDDPHGTRPWCKAAAVANGVAATDAAVLVVHDADVWCDATMTAVAEVAAGRARWAIPHRDVYRLKTGPTAAVLDGSPVPYERKSCITKPYKGWEGGGIVVLTRDLWQQVPLDPRFVGWGQEDESWALALRTLAGQPWRGTASLVHLWHEPQPRACNEYGSLESHWLAERYVEAAAARDGGASMRALITASRRAA